MFNNHNFFHQEWYQQDCLWDILLEWYSEYSFQFVTLIFSFLLLRWVLGICVHSFEQLVHHGLDLRFRSAFYFFLFWFHWEFDLGDEKLGSDLPYDDLRMGKHGAWLCDIFVLLDKFFRNLTLILLGNHRWCLLKLKFGHGRDGQDFWSLWVLHQVYRRDILYS